MFSAIFTTIVMFSAVALAAPISYNTTVSYDDIHHIFDRRAFTGTPVCGMGARDAQLATKCNAHQVWYTVQGNVLKAISPSAASPAGAQCDHALDLQVLQRALNANGACTALQSMADAAGIASTTNDITTFKSNALNDIFVTVNQQSNAIWLDAALNQEKNFVVQAGMTGGANRPASANLNAVKQYMRSPQIRSDTLLLARSLDAKTVTAINTAKVDALQRIAARYPNQTNARQIKAKEDADNAVNDAYNAFMTNVGARSGVPTPGIATLWSSVLTYAANQPTA